MISRNDQLSHADTNDARFNGETGRVRYHHTDEYCVIPSSDSERPLGEALFYQLADPRTNDEWQVPTQEPTQLTTGYALEGDAPAPQASASATADDDIYHLEDTAWSQAG